MERRFCLVFKPVIFFVSAEKSQQWLITAKTEQRNRIIPMCASGTASEYSSGAHYQSVKRPVLLKGIKHILRAGRHMTAGWMQEWGDREPVNEYRNREKI
jgi:hypothetical protein